MGSRHHSLNMSAVADLLDLMMAFEEHNQIRVKIDLEVVNVENKPDLMITAKAMSRSPENTEVIELASVSVKCSATNLKNVNDAVTHAMYALDFRLAANEWDATKPKKT